MITSVAHKTTAFVLFVACAVVSGYTVAGVASVVPGAARFVLGCFALGAAVFVAQQLRDVDRASLHLGVAVAGALGGAAIVL